MIFNHILSLPSEMRSSSAVAAAVFLVAAVVVIGGRPVAGLAFGNGERQFHLRGGSVAEFRPADYDGYGP